MWMTSGGGWASSRKRSSGRRLHHVPVVASEGGGGGVEVLVATPRQPAPARLALLHLPGGLHGIGHGVGRLQRRHQSLEPRQRLERLQRLRVRDGGVLEPAEVAGG